MKVFSPAKITQRRKQLELSINKLAKEIGSSSTAISYIENGKHSPRISTVCKIADALECNVDDFLVSPYKGEEKGGE